MSQERHTHDSKSLSFLGDSARFGMIFILPAFSCVPMFVALHGVDLDVSFRGCITVEEGEISSR